MSSNQPSSSSSSLTQLIKPSLSGCLLLVGIFASIGLLVYVIFWGLMNAPAGSNQTLNTGIYQTQPSTQASPSTLPSPSPSKKEKP